MKLFSRRQFQVLSMALALFALPMAIGPAAAQSGSIELSAEQRAAVQRISDFINSFESLRGDFVQISPRGNTTRGVMLISKPGKLRFDYAPPSPLLIVSDGKWLTITNKEKNKGDQVPLSVTPLRFIVSNAVDLLRDASVVGFEQNEGFTSVAFAERGKDAAKGFITLVFDEAKSELQQWIITDGKGQKTTVQIGNLERDVALNPKLFAVTIKRPEQSNN